MSSTMHMSLSLRLIYLPVHKIFFASASSDLQKIKRLNLKETMTNLRYITEESQRLSQIISGLYFAGDKDMIERFFVLL